MAANSLWSQYLNALKTNYAKITRLDFLQPDGSVAFSLDNNPYGVRSKTFIQDGSLSVNLQNGTRRTASVRLSNLNGEYDYNVNNVWFGQQIRILMGMILPNGQEYLIPQGVFYIQNPEENQQPGERTAVYNLVDKWAYLDGTLNGELEGAYECPVNSNIFGAVDAILKLPLGNGKEIDSVPATYTDFYNGKFTTLPDGSTVPLTNTPYTVRVDSDHNTYADVILALNEMLAGWIGYDSYGSLRLDPSQDDILDTNKPIEWTFSPSEQEFLGATYTVLNSEVRNDIIRVGESLGGYALIGARAQNYDPSSDTNINLIGLKTDRESKAGYYTNDICASLAEFELKRKTILKKSITIRSKQMFHLTENNLVLIKRTDKTGQPMERHLVTGFNIPLTSTGEMTINATSVSDFPIATISYLTNQS